LRALLRSKLLFARQVEDRANRNTRAFCHSSNSFIVVTLRVCALVVVLAA
jgi:hypothetical protein